jgi:hypothetical protein
VIVERIEPPPTDEEAAAIEAALKELAREQAARGRARSAWIEAARREALDPGV